MSYLIINEDTEEIYGTYGSIEQAEEEAGLVLNGEIADAVSIYQLLKTGERVSRINWSNVATKANGSKQPTLPERPAYQGANKRWSDDEKLYAKKAHEGGMSHEGIAKKLGRTPHAVEVQLSRLRCN